jgi:hypothetical protein
MSSSLGRRPSPADLKREDGEGQGFGAITGGTCWCSQVMKGDSMD